MARKSYGGNDPLDDATNVVVPGPTMEEVDAQIYGRINVPETGNQVAKPIALMDIQPDLTQPRRAVPAAVRGQFDGDPEDIPGLLGNWHILAKKHNQFDIDVTKLVAGAIDLAPGSDDRNPIVDEFLALISLAASIHRDGLANPITVSAQGGAYVVETGERRLLAHWLLATYIDKKYQKIPARLVDRADVWRQAAENGARRPLGAIGMARQLALLIMDMYASDPGEKFMSYRDMVLPGESDRKFYAQVANGNLYRIKQGMAQRVLDVTGLKYIQRVGAYRSLLSIPDAVWIEADTNDWTLGGIQTYVDALKPTTPVSQSDKTSQICDVLPDEVTQTIPEPAQKPHSVDPDRPMQPGDKVWMKSTLHAWQTKILWTVQSIDANQLAMLIGVDEREEVKRAYQYVHLLRLDDEPEAAPVQPVLPEFDGDYPGEAIEPLKVWFGGRLYQVGDEMMHISGAEVIVQGFRVDGPLTLAEVTVLTDRGGYESCCPVTELTKPAPVIETSQPPARPAPTPTPFTQPPQPMKPASKPEYVAPNANRAIADEMRLASMLAKLQGLAELTGDVGMRDTCNYLRTVTPAQIYREMQQTSKPEYQGKVAAALAQTSDFLMGLAQQVHGLLETMLDVAERK